MSGETISESRLREQDEIQKAHDQLAGILLGDVDLGLGPERLRDLNIATSVLCWCLHHDHNKAFGRALAALEDEAAARGYTMRRGL